MTTGKKLLMVAIFSVAAVLVPWILLNDLATRPSTSIRGRAPIPPHQTPAEEKARATSPRVFEKANPFLKRYAGEYLIKIEGVKADVVEKYILKPTGECIWKWETGPYPETKYGTWTGEDGKIVTTTRGKSGDIPEVFTLIDGKLRSEWGYDRCLIKIRSL